jgi:hypothetical protein
MCCFCDFSEIYSFAGFENRPRRNVCGSSDRAVLISLAHLNFSRSVLISLAHLNFSRVVLTS